MKLAILRHNGWLSGYTWHTTVNSMTSTMRGADALRIVFDDIFLFMCEIIFLS